jgi:tRNA 2-thiouridine synthesizing protein B
MSTLYQLHGNLTSLKQHIDTLAMTWQPQDSVLLLGETVAYLDWLDAYIADSEMPEMTLSRLYVLQADIDALSLTTQQYLNIASRACQVLSDSDWVALTLSQYETASSVLESSSPNKSAANPQFSKVVTIA